MRSYINKECFLLYCTTTTTFGSLPVSWSIISTVFRDTYSVNAWASLNPERSLRIVRIALSSAFSSPGTSATGGSPTTSYLIVYPDAFLDIPTTSTHWDEIWKRSWSSCSPVYPTIRPSIVMSFFDIYWSVSRIASLVNSRSLPLRSTGTWSFAYPRS